MIEELREKINKIILSVYYHQTDNLNGTDGALDSIAHIIDSAYKITEEEVTKARDEVLHNMIFDLTYEDYNKEVAETINKFKGINIKLAP